MLLYQVLPGFILFVFCVYSFFREGKLEHLRYFERDRLADEHILRETERYFAAQKKAQSCRSGIERKDS